MDAVVIKEDLVARKEELVGLMGEFIAGMEAELVRIIKEGRAADEENEEVGTNRNKAHPDVLPVITFTTSLPQPDTLPVDLSPAHAALSAFSPDTRFLLRADSLFNGTHIAHTYPKHHYFIQMDWHYAGPWGVPTNGTVGYNAKASRLARRMLRELGRPDALDIEMCAVGERFLCGRCDEYVQPVEWSEMVRLTSSY